MKIQKTDYRAIAESLGVKYLFGSWGIDILPRNPAGNPYKLFALVPLEGWITDPKEIEREMRERGLEL